MKLHLSYTEQENNPARLTISYGNKNKGGHITINGTRDEIAYELSRPSNSNTKDYLDKLAIAWHYE
jgi:hypothetical protein